MSIAATAPFAFTVEPRDERHARLLEKFGGPVPGIPGDGTPVVLHTDIERGLTYTWHDQSTRIQDIQSREDGYLVNSLEVTYGEHVVAYLNIQTTTAELMAATFDNAFEWADRNTGACFRFDRDEEKVSDAQIWASAYTHLSKRPPSAANLHTWGSYSADQAPTDPKVLAKEVAAAEKVFAKQMAAFVEWLSVPFVDYAHVDGPYEAAQAAEGHPGALRGTGVGRMMYLLAARHLAKTRGMVLRASGCQTQDAQGLWSRFVADPSVPTRSVSVMYWQPRTSPCVAACIDFTK